MGAGQRQQGEFTIPKISQQVLADFERLVSPETAFVEDQCFVEPTATVSKERLYQRYREWCTETGHAPANNVTFAVRLRALRPEIDVIRPRGQGKRIQAWIGIGVYGSASGGGQGGQG